MRWTAREALVERVAMAAYEAVRADTSLPAWGKLSPSLRREWLIASRAALDVSPIGELVEALETARGYVAKVHGSLGRAVGPDNIVLPDLQKIDAALALALANGTGGDNG